jgi:hypothetical protein
LIDAVDAQAHFTSPGPQDLQQVAFEADGQLDGGEFKVKGDGLIEDQAFNVAVQTTDLPTPGLTCFCRRNMALPAAA